MGCAGSELCAWPPVNPIGAQDHTWPSQLCHRTRPAAPRGSTASQHSLPAASGGEEHRLGAQQFSWLMQRYQKARADPLSALAVPSISAVLHPLRASGCLSQGSGCNSASSRGRKAGERKGCCSLQSWLRSWPGRFLSEMLAQVAGEITQRGEAGLFLDFAWV